MKAKIEFDITGDKIITDLPDIIDPVILIEKKVRECPFCKTDKHVNKPQWRNTLKQYADKKGVHHKIFTFLNKYLWEKYIDLHCKECGCTWDTNWFPADREMFKISISDDEAPISELNEKFNTVEIRDWENWEDFWKKNIDE